MAVTKLMNIKSSLHGSGRHLSNSIRYIMNPEKTKGGLLTGGNAGTTWGEVYTTMMETKQEWEKTEGRQGYHFVMSWEPGEIDEGAAYQIVKEFCEEYLGEKYDCVFSIHDDQKHMHGHIVFNSVNRMDGYKYHYKKGDWEKNIQPITDKICVKHGLRPLSFDSEKRGKSYAETMTEKTGKNNWNKIIRADLDYAISQADTYHDFLDVMGHLEYKIKSRNIRGKPELALTAPGQGNARRTSTLGNGYTLAEIKERIGKEKNIFEYPKTPKMKHCIIKNPSEKYTSLSRYQVKRVSTVHQLQTRFVKNQYAVNQSKVRKNLLQIDRLREDCRYLIKAGIHNKVALNRQEEKLKQEERFLKTKRSSYDLLQEDAAYINYTLLAKQIETIEIGDDSFEKLEDQLELLSDRLPYGHAELDKNLQAINSRLTEIRREKRIIRHIKKEENQEIKSVSLFVEKSRKGVHPQKGEATKWMKK